LPLPAEAEGIWTDIWYYEAHNSTALEGNTLVRKEVEALLRAGRAVGNKELKDYLEVKGYGDAARWVYDQALNQGDWSSNELVTATEIRHIHELPWVPSGMLRRTLIPLAVSVRDIGGSMISIRSSMATAAADASLQTFSWYASDFRLQLFKSATGHGI
jgi:hypothetical protein